MTSSNLRRSILVAAATGVSSLVLAAPAAALELPDPRSSGSAGTSSVGSSDGIWTEVGLGALGGLALVGAGAAATTAMRHHHRHAAHPA